MHLGKNKLFGWGYVVTDPLSALSFFERSLNGVAYLQMLNEAVFLKLLKPLEINFETDIFNDFGGHKMVRPCMVVTKLKNGSRNSFANTITLNHPV